MINASLELLIGGNGLIVMMNKDNLTQTTEPVKEKREEMITEETIRRSIRGLLKNLMEAGAPDNNPAPHNNTGINVLEDLLKKILPTIETDYKLLTSNIEQRESFRAHIINAVVDTLAPMETNNSVGLEGQEGLEEEIEIDIDADDESVDAEDDMFIDIEPEKKEEEQEEEDPRDAFGIEGENETGRNMAYSTYNKVEQNIIDAYDLLSDPEDEEIFRDYLVANLKLYFDKYEDQITPVEEPTNQAYETAKKAKGESEKEIDLEF